MTVQRNYINGEWIDSAVDPIVDRNPSDVNDVVGSYAAADAAQTNRAIEAARGGLPGVAPLKLKGATASPIRPIAIPIRP